MSTDSYQIARYVMCNEKITGLVAAVGMSEKNRQLEEESTLSVYQQHYSVAKLSPSPIST
jgi:uncharacterized protein YhbP (UPF0306 family)